MSPEQKDLGGKMITSGKRQGEIIIKGKGGEEVRLVNPIKERSIPAELLENLRSLAILAEGTFEDSSDQAFFNSEIVRLKTKYPSEQPEEVWRRSLATIMNKGIKISDVASALLRTNQEFLIEKRLGTMGDTEKEEKLNMLQAKISEYWPSPRSIK